MAVSQESIGFLMGTLMRAKSLLFRSLLAPYGMTPRQYGILSRLWEEDGMHLNELATRMYADPSSLSRTLVDMEQSGFIHRERGSLDRRVYHLYLTDQAKDLRTQLSPLVARHNEELLEGIASVDIEIMKRTIKRMLTNIRKEKSGNCP